MRQLVWISYDFGIDGDYSSMYHWLDSKKAKECGNNLAAFTYEFETDLIKEISKDIKNTVRIRKTDRIYIIYGYYSGDQKKFKGKFLFGKRKPAPWEGFAGEELDEDEDYES